MTNVRCADLFGTPRVTALLGRADRAFAVLSAGADSGSLLVMTMLRFRSAEDPFSDAAVAGKAARLLALAETTGAWQPNRVVTILDRSVFSEALEQLAERGVATAAPLDWVYRAKDGASEFAAFIDSVQEAVAQSPLPDLELPKLDREFGTERTAHLVGAGFSSLRRYITGERVAPDAVANRAHYVVRIVSDLAGSYNDQGVVRWFQRRSRRLDGQSPEEVLSGDWDPDSDGARAVFELAHEHVY